MELKIRNLYLTSFNLYFSKLCIYLLCILNSNNLIINKIYNYWYILFNPYKIYIKFFFKKDYITFLKKISITCNKINFIYFLKLRLKGLGFRIHKVVTGLIKFFFTQINFFYSHIPNNIQIRLKLRLLLIIGNDLYTVRQVFINLLLLKRISIYRIRGFVYPRQFIMLKPGKKR